MKLAISSLVIFSSLLVSCGADQKAQEQEKYISVINQENLESRVVNNSISTKQIDSPKHFDANNIAGKLCEVINAKELESPFQLEEIVSVKEFNQTVASWKDLNGTITCEEYEVLLSEFPVMIMRTKDKSLNWVNYVFTINEDLKIKSVSLNTQQDFRVKKHMVSMRDGVKLATYMIGRADKSKTTIFNRTPYFNTSSTTYFSYYSQIFSKLGFNMVIQSNRGAHESEGHFRWLHKENINDSEDTLNWLSQQNFNSGEVIAWGVSYDGFNALATSITNHDSLTSVVACSAPAKASGDSFTSNGQVQQSLLLYIWGRESVSPINLFNQKVQFLIEKDIDFSEFDNQLFGRNIGDWDDLINGNSLKEYWNARTLYDDIEKSTVPTYHVAGLLDDQDSRDTVKFFREKAKDKVNNMLYMHSKGHGCGDFFKSEQWKLFNNQEFDRIPKFLSYSLKEDKVVARDEFVDSLGHIKSIKLSNVGNYQGILYDSHLAEYKEARRTVLALQVTQEMQLNGMTEIDIEYRNLGYQDYITASLFKLDKSNQYHPLSKQAVSSSRNGFSTTSSSIKIGQAGKATIIFPPHIEKIKVGEYIVLTLDLDTPVTFDLESKKKIEFNNKFDIENPLIRIDSATARIPLEGQQE